MALVIRTTDDQFVEVPESTIKKSITISDMVTTLQDTTEPTPMPFSSEVMSSVIEFNAHFDECTDEILPTELFKSEWVQNFLQRYDSIEENDKYVEQLIEAANFLCNKLLLDTCAHFIAEIINELGSAEEIRKRFNLPNDLNDEKKDVATE